LSVDRAVGEHGPVSGDPGDPEASAELIGEVVGKQDGQIGGYDGVLGSGAERPIRLGPIHPHPLADPAMINVGADCVDDTGGIAVRDHTWIRHR
jgi:hypothetical protein